jgi:tRNA nucleotidyltransferase (CCA-adding enzyme)
MRLYEVDRPKLDVSSLRTAGVVQLSNAMRDAGFEVRIVGGAVRDLVLNKEPKDIDMATDATPDEMIEVFDKAGIRHEPTGLQHGTLTVILDGEPIEITTLRIDKETDGRHAEVEFTRDWKTDAERRDLTFNAMSVDLDGNLYDYFGGVEDLKNGVSKFVGNAGDRMDEDFLRILRYFRFQGRMANPNWDQDTLATIKQKAAGMKKISGERVWAEVGKILSGNHAADVVKMIGKTGVADHIMLPTKRVNELARVRQKTANPVVALSALMDDMYDLEEIKARWKISNEEFAMANFIIKHRDEALDESKLQRMLSNPKANRKHVAALALYQGNVALAKQAKSWKAPVFPVTGNDLAQAGVKQGPEMGKLLADMRKRWEDLNFTLDKEELLRIL